MLVCTMVELVRGMGMEACVTAGMLIDDQHRRRTVHGWRTGSRSVDPHLQPQPRHFLLWQLAYAEIHVTDVLRTYQCRCWKPCERVRTAASAVLTDLLPQHPPRLDHRGDPDPAGTAP